MITVVSIANSLKGNDNEIECAYNDAKNVYNTIKEISGEDFSEYNSICINNLTKDLIMKCIDSVKKSIDQEGSTNSTIILYYSGHAKYENESLMLKCKYDEYIEIQEITTILKWFYGGVIIVLDCCYSGLALSEANILSFCNKNNISIICSATENDTSNYSDNGSEFTNFFCEILKEAKENMEDITLNSIEKIFRQNSKNFIYRKSINDKFIIKSKYNYEEEQNIKMQFCNKFNSKTSFEREIMLYSLGDYPTKLKIQILEGLYDQLQYEGNWLIRRAYGSILSGCSNPNSSRLEIISKMLNSNSWMTKCIGIIGIRKDLTNYKDIIKDIIIKEDNIDCVWLANLYFSDSEYRDIQIALKSKMARTKWGILEIYKQYNDKIDNALEIIKNEIHDKELHEYLDIYLNKDKIDLIKFMKTAKKRGKIRNEKNKWIFSNLFGNWRNHLELDLNDYLESNREVDIKKNLKELQWCSDYNIRMNLFQYFIENDRYLNLYYDELEWGIKDEHPWVRREAINCLYGNRCMEIDDYRVDSSMYPGTLDYYITLLKFGIVDLNTIKQFGLLKIEIEALIKECNSNNYKKSDILLK